MRVCTFNAMVLKMTHLKTSLFVAVAFLTFVPLAISQSGPEESAKPSASIELPDPVATVNGEPISRADLEAAFERAVASAGASADDIPAPQKLAGYRQILNDMVMEKLVEEESKDVSVPDADVQAEVGKIKAQFPNEEAFKEQLSKMGESPEQLSDTVRSMLKQRKWIEGKIAGQDAVSDEDAKKYFEENKEEFDMPELVQARHILFLVPEDAPEEKIQEKKAAAEKAIERAKAGEDFGELATELSEDEGTKSRGGELPPFPKGRMVPAFEEAAFKQEVGEVGEPVRTPYGFHVIKVEDKQPAKTLTFDEVKPRLVQILQNEKRQEAVNDLVEGLREQAEVQINLPEGGTPGA